MITIYDGTMMELRCKDGPTCAVAYRQTDGMWRVAEYPEPGSVAYSGRTYTRDQAITALSIIERRAEGFDWDDPVIKDWLEELSGTVSP